MIQPPTPAQVRQAIEATHASPLARRPALAQLVSVAHAALTLALVSSPLLVSLAPTGDALSLTLGLTLGSALPGGLGMLMAAILLHECAHLSLPWPRWAQQALGWLLGVWTLTPYTSYRQGHLAHHRWLGSPEGRDPTASPQRPRAPSRVLDLLLWARLIPVFYWGGVWGPYLIYALRPTAHARSARAVAAWALSMSASLCLLIALPALLMQSPARLWLAWGLSFWLGSLLYEHLFTMHQHLGLLAVPQGKTRYSPSEQVSCSRSTRQPGAWLLYHFNLHKEHHLSPGTPYYLLPALHGALRQARRDLYDYTDERLSSWARRSRRAHEQLAPRPGDDPASWHDPR